MNDLETKRSTENALKAFATQPLKAAATGRERPRSSRQ
jgi:hypothetical protein